MHVDCLTDVQSQDGPWEESIFEAGVALNAPVLSASGSQAEQEVFEDLCSGETAAPGDIVEGGKRTVLITPCSLF